METVEYKHRLDSKLVTKAAATAAGTYDTDYEPDESYQEIVGIAAVENSSGGLTNGYYRLRVKDEDQVFVELTHKNILLTTSSVPQSDKFMAVNIPIRKGRKIKLGLYFEEALASQLSVEFVFLLRKTVVAG